MEFPPLAPPRIAQPTPGASLYTSKRKRSEEVQEEDENSIEEITMRENVNAQIKPLTNLHSELKDEIKSCSSQTALTIKPVLQFMLKKLNNQSNPTISSETQAITNLFTSILNGLNDVIENNTNQLHKHPK